MDPKLQAHLLQRMADTRINPYKDEPFRKRGRSDSGEGNPPESPPSPPQAGGGDMGWYVLTNVFGLLVRCRLASNAILLN